jgi:hypothetical protein
VRKHDFAKRFLGRLGRTDSALSQAHALESHTTLTAWLDRVDAATRQPRGQALRGGGSLAAAA